MNTEKGALCTLFKWCVWKGVSILNFQIYGVRVIMFDVLMF